MRIRTNYSSINANRQFSMNNSIALKDLEKLASGFRINRAADDASGLAISAKMRAQIRGIDTGERNALDGISLIQTAEGATEEVQEILHRMRELAIKSANDTMDNDIDRKALDKEYQTLVKEIDRIAYSTNFNTLPVLTANTEMTPVYKTITEIVQEPIYETITVLIDDVIMSRVQASVTDPPVNPNGSFRFFAQNADGDTSKLLFNGEIPTTSHPSIRINGQNYELFGSNARATLDQSPTHSNGVWTTVYGIRENGVDVSIVQRVSIVNNPVTSGGQSYKIDYEVINNSSTDVTFDFKYHVDTKLGNNDNAPFVVGGNEITHGTSYSGSNIPGVVNIFDDATNPYINGVISVNSSSGLAFTAGSEPDRLHLAQFSAANTFGTPSSTSAVGDSGYALIWDNRTATSSSSVLMTTYYGVKNPPDSVLNTLGPTVKKQVLVGHKEVTQTREELVGYDAKSIDSKIWIQCSGIEGDGLYIDLFDFTTATLKVSDTGVEPKDLADIAMDSISGALEYVSSKRADFGASQNRLEHVIKSNQVMSENLTASESRISDLDMAKGMVEYTKNNILSQSAQAMMAHANQQPQAVMQLLN